jgi:hypothetical protein
MAGQNPPGLAPGIPLKNPVKSKKDGVEDNIYI